MEEQTQAQVPKRTFKDALQSPVTPAPVAEATPPTDTAGIDHPVTTAGAPAKHKKKATAVTGSSTPVKAGAADKNAAPVVAPKRIFAEIPKKKVKKGGRVAMRAEDEAAAAAAIAEAGKKAGGKPGNGQKKVKKVKKPAPSDEDDVEEDRVMVPFNYKSPKPRVITEALFLWEIVAAFSEPPVALLLERLCQDVAISLQQSRKANHLMQRYWNAQWAKMVWEGDKIPVEKRLLTPNSLTRSEGKIDWKKMFREEYPLWLQRTFTGVGSNNNATNVAKVLFRHHNLNEKKTGAELAKVELSVEESMQKAQRKRGVTVDVDDAKSDDASVDGSPRTHHNGGEGSGGPTGKALKVRVAVHDPSAGFTRADYKQNYRQGTRKGKHMKGGDKKWGSYAAFDVDDDMY